MATLYVENVPDDLYEALRSRAKARRRSIAAEVLALLKENIPTEQELKARHEWVGLAIFEKLILNSQRIRSPRETPGIGETGVVGWRWPDRRRPPQGGKN